MAWAKRSVVLVQIGACLRVLSVGLRVAARIAYVESEGFAPHSVGGLAIAFHLQPSGVLSPCRRLRLPVARDHRPLERAGRVKGGAAGELRE
jgi:hypothetical protein